MEVGLTARVKPDLDDRATRKEADRLNEFVTEAIQDLKAHMDFAEVEDGVENVLSHSGHVAEDTEIFAENVERAADSLEGIQMPQLSQLDTDGFAGDVLFGDGPAGSGGEDDDGGGGALSDVADLIPSGDDDGGGMGEGMLGELKDVFADNKKITASMLTRMGSLQALTKGVGRILARGGGKIAIVGFGLILLGGLLAAMTKSSSLLAQVLGLFTTAIGLFFRPFGDLLGMALLPIANGILTLASGFAAVFGNDGILSALGWLAQELAVILIDGFWALLEWLAISLPMFIIQNLPEILAAVLIAGLLVALAPIIKPLALIAGAILALLGVTGDTEERVSMVADAVMGVWDTIVGLIDVLPNALLGALTGALIIALTATGILPTAAAILGALLIINSLIFGVDTSLEDIRAGISDWKYRKYIGGAFR